MNYFRDSRRIVVKLGTSTLTHNTGHLNLRRIERIVKGYRNDADLVWEREQAEYNMKHGGYETELILCDDSLKHISSTLVREKIKSGESLDGLLPKSVEEYISSLK